MQAARKKRRISLCADTPSQLGRLGQRTSSEKDGLPRVPTCSLCGARKGRFVFKGEKHRPRSVDVGVFSQASTRAAFGDHVLVQAELDGRVAACRQ